MEKKKIILVMTTTTIFEVDAYDAQDAYNVLNSEDSTIRVDRVEVLGKNTSYTYAKENK